MELEKIHELRSLRHARLSSPKKLWEKMDLALLYSRSWDFSTLIKEPKMIGRGDKKFRSDLLCTTRMVIALFVPQGAEIADSGGSYGSRLRSDGSEMFVLMTRATFRG